MKKILNKLLILYAILLLVLPVSAASTKRIITPVLYNNSSGQLEYRLYDEASTLTITDGSISDKQRTHLYAYGKTYCRPWEVSMSSDECRLDYDGQWSYLSWGSQNINVGSTETDYALADSGMTLLVNSYNDVINFYTDWGREWVPYVDSGNRGSVGDLYTLFTNKSLTIGDWTIKLETNINPSETELKSLEKTVKRSSISTDDVQYARISVTGPNNFADLIKGYETSKVIIWGINKPYNVGKKEYITLEGLCQYATVAAEINENDDVDYKPGLFADTGAFEQFETVSATEEAVNGIFGGITTTLTKIVGFDEPEDLIFSNQSNTYLGMMPQTWWEASNTMFWFFEVIAILVLFASVINSAIKQSMASISPNIRNTLKDSIANLGIAIVLLILYAPMFYILAKINSMLVVTLSSFANEMGVTLANTVDPVTSLGSTMINFILDLLLFFINAGLIVKINLDYFVRSITIMLLHVMAPVAIASISFDNRRTLFNNWLKELTGNIFMQSFNALVLAMIMIVLKGGTVHWWYYQAALFAIASLNSWFMNIFGLQNSVAGMADRVQSQASKALEQAKNGGLVGAAAGVGASVVGAGSTIKFGTDAVGAMSGGSGKGNFNANNASKAVDGNGGPNKTGTGPATAQTGTGAEGSKGNNAEKMSGKFNAEISEDGNVKVTPSHSEQSDTSEEKGQEEMKKPSFGDKAKVFGAAMVAANTKNDYLRKAMNDYIGYNPERDKNGEKGYFGYQSMGVANKENDKHIQQQRRKQEQERQEEQQREHDKKLNEIHKATVKANEEEQQRLEDEKKEQIEYLEEQEQQNSSRDNFG